MPVYSHVPTCTYETRSVTIDRLVDEMAFVDERPLPKRASLQDDIVTR